MQIESEENIMKKAIIAVFTSLFMGFIGLIVGVLVDECFGGVNFEFTPYISTIFVIVTMGSFIIYYNDTKK